MSVFSSVAFMGASTALRILSGLITFTFLARTFGPELFGQFMFWFSIATLIGLIANYGLTPYMLREIAIQQDRASQLIGQTLMAKLILITLIIIIAIVYLILSASEHKMVFICLLIAMMFDSVTDFLNAGYRATQRFAAETKIATYASVIQLLFSVVIVSLYPTILAASIAALVSRVVITVMTLFDQLKYFKDTKLGSLIDGYTQLKQSIAYALDFLLQNLLGQVDSVVIAAYAGASSVGVYQAGMRIFQGFAQSANIMSNVFIPRLAATNQKNQPKEADIVQLAFIGVGLVLGLGMAIAAKPITLILFGNEFKNLAELLPWFGLFFLVRFYAASLGVILTAIGMQSYRTYTNIVVWLIIFLCSYFIMPVMGVSGWLASLVIGNIFLSIFYMFKVRKSFKISIYGFLIALIGVMMFLYFLYDDFKYE